MLDGAIFQHEDSIHRLHDAHPVRDHDHGGAAPLQIGERLDQGVLSVGIEIGVRLVEHHVPRLPEESAREGNALALATRQSPSRRTDLRVVALGKAQDHLVTSRELSCLHDLFVGRFHQARDVLPYRAPEELDVLRQVADVMAEVSARPREDIGSVEPDHARYRLQHADQNSRERGLARARGPDQCQRSTGR